MKSRGQTQPMQFTDLNAQYAALRTSIEARIHRVLEHGQYILGPEVAEMEAALSRYTGARHCISVASGTEALLISLMALDLQPGDEVITSPFTFVATAEMIVLLGAKPVFVDIEPDTCNIDATKIEAEITPRTRAIMPVSLYGQCADMDEIEAIARRHGNLPVIEDAAQSFGASYRGRKSCNLSSFGCTSYNRLAQACREIRVHGQSSRYTHTRIGVGGRMDTLQCAIVLAKLERFEWEIARRIEVGKRYADLIAGIEGVRLLGRRNDRECVWGQYTVLVERRDEVQAAMKARGIPTAVHYPRPIHRQPAYADLTSFGSLEHSERACAQVLSLPMSADLTERDQDRVVVELRAATRALAEVR